MYLIPVILVLPYFIILMGIWINLRKINKEPLQPFKQVFVSVIVPCRNEESHLPFLLDDLARQDYPSDLFEVLVVDDNSIDSTPVIAACFSKIKNLSVIKNTGAGKKSAIRTGINIASGQLIITTDADCRMKEKWMKTISSFFYEHKPDMLICPVQLENKSGLFGRFQELEFLSLQGITAGSSISGNATMCNGANLSFTKETYLKHTDNLHYEIISGDDIFFLQSLKKESGSKIMWLESIDALVTASASTGIKEFIMQRKRWISKGRAYSDRYTILLAIVTFVTNFQLLSLMIACMFNQEFFLALIAAFMLKAFPDFLILLNTSLRYKRKSLMKWFLPAEVIYPLYVLVVTFYYLFSSGKQTINSPSRKGI